MICKLNLNAPEGDAKNRATAPRSAEKRHAFPWKPHLLGALLCLILIPGLVLLLQHSGGSESSAQNARSDDTVSSDVVYKVAMITDYGDVFDQSFNEATYTACKSFCEENNIAFTCYRPPNDSASDRLEMVQKAVDDGYNVIVMAGFIFMDTLPTAQDRYPDVKFVTLDVYEADLQYYSADGAARIADNAYCAVYQEHLSGFMAGYAAVMLGYDQLGFLGGMATPAIMRYGYGFVQGCDAAAQKLGKSVSLKYVYGNQFFGDADITEAMDAWYEAGTQVVFACGGGIYTSAAEAAARNGGKVIGVDVDQAASIDGDYGQGITVTSALKGIAASVRHVLSETILYGRWEHLGGKEEALGLVSGDDPSMNYVGLPTGAGTQWSDSFTVNDYYALVQNMFNGSITVSNQIDSTPEPAAVRVEWQGAIK